MHCASEAVEEAALNAAVFKELTNILQGVDSLLNGLRWETVHKIGMHQDAGIREPFGHLGHLLN